MPSPINDPANLAAQFEPNRTNPVMDEEELEFLDASAPYLRQVQILLFRRDLGGALKILSDCYSDILADSQPIGTVRIDEIRGSTAKTVRALSKHDVTTIEDLAKINPATLQDNFHASRLAAIYRRALQEAVRRDSIKKPFIWSR